jgi:hypothetical protein
MLLRVIVVLGTCAGLVLAGTGCGASASGDRAATSAPSRVHVVATGRAPLAQPWSQVRITGGTAAQHTALQHILRGIGWTAIRTIRIGAPARGFTGGGPESGFYYVIAVPAGAQRLGVQVLQGQWEASIVGESYDAVARTSGLPRLTFVASANLLPGGRTVGDSEGVATNYHGRVGERRTDAELTRLVRRGAAAADFRVVALRFIHPLSSMPVVVHETSGHRRLTDRIGTFLNTLLDGSHADLAYVELRSPCGRRVFARGEGVAVNPDWLSICSFALSCPISIGGDDHPPRPTYPC